MGYNNFNNQFVQTLFVLSFDTVILDPFRHVRSTIYSKTTCSLFVAANKRTKNKKGVCLETCCVFCFFKLKVFIIRRQEKGTFNRSPGSGIQGTFWKIVKWGEGKSNQKMDVDPFICFFIQVCVSFTYHDSQSTYKLSFLVSSLKFPHGKTANPFACSLIGNSTGNSNRPGSPEANCSPFPHAVRCVSESVA